ncbi:EAL domain-containing protein [Aminobacter sp. AP02]|uniref:putative bifunctional diguanylate cyclase/phosphodiesterase n=1 Tax=Aminobacter sp. AP02 TaxID=2135737 RepID=UPI001FE0C5B9|nr:EAL domain-containing protein [Aminobacter sp. AP02]
MTGSNTFPELLANSGELITFYDRNYRLTHSTARFKALRGPTVTEGASLFDLYPGLAAGEARVALEQVLVDGQSNAINVTSGSNREGMVLVFVTAAGLGLVELTDGIAITAATKAEHSKLLHQATHDVLTGLQNRQRFSERLNEILATNDNVRERSALLQIDLDDFKSVNDTLGHATGDALLKLAANRIRSVLQDGDSAFRYAGDEFAIVQYGKDASDAEIVAQALVESFKAPFIINDMPLFVGASVGIAYGPQHGAESSELMKAADIALYAAKRDGRGCVRVFNRSMLLLLEQRENLRRNLRLALERKELDLEYQPLVHASGQIVGFEALVRWNHSEIGLIPPNVFIPIAEADGLMDDIGRWVLEEACRQAKTWPDTLSVAVNLSPAQFLGGSLTDTVAQVIDSSGIRADRLELEITESVLLEQTVDNLDTLNTLNVLGIRISLDDFGTHYSSLSYLKNFPFDSLKIDQYFIKDLDIDGKSQTIVRAIIGLAHGLDMMVTAEGVETARQAEWLIKEGCDLLQGHHLGRAMSAERARVFASKAGASLNFRQRIR